MKIAYLESDASLDPRRELVGLDGRLYLAGGGIVLRNILLRPLSARAVPLGYLPGPLHAETLALAAGLEAANALGIEGVWASTDSERLADAFNGRSTNRSPGLEHCEAQLRLAAAKLVFARVRWSRGSHRQVRFGGPSADSLARAAIGLGHRR